MFKLLKFKENIKEQDFSDYIDATISSMNFRSIDKGLIESWESWGSLR